MPIVPCFPQNQVMPDRRASLSDRHPRPAGQASFNICHYATSEFGTCGIRPVLTIVCGLEKSHSVFRRLCFLFDAPALLLPLLLPLALLPALLLALLLALPLLLLSTAWTSVSASPSARPSPPPTTTAVAFVPPTGPPTLGEDTPEEDEHKAHRTLSRLPRGGAATTPHLLHSPPFPRVTPHPPLGATPPPPPTPRETSRAPSSPSPNPSPPQQ